MTPGSKGGTTWTGHNLWSDWWLPQMSAESLHPATDGGDSETQGQTLDQTRRVQLRRGRKDIIGKLTEMARLPHGNSESEPTNREPSGNHLGPLHIQGQLCSLVYMWDSWQREQELSQGLWLDLVHLFLMPDCLSLPEYRGRNMILRQFDILCFVGTHGKLAPFKVNTGDAREGRLWSEWKINKLKFKKAPVIFKSKCNISKEKLCCLQ